MRRQNKGYITSTNESKISTPSISGPGFQSDKLREVEAKSQKEQLMIASWVGSLVKPLFKQTGKILKLEKFTVRKISSWCALLRPAVNLKSHVDPASFQLFLVEY